MNHRDVTRKLRNLGCYFDRQGRGSHEIWRNPATRLNTVVPNWGSRDLTPGTLRSIIRELGILKRDFDNA